MYDRYWLLTSTTYGNWLPGDRRGFVSGVRDESDIAMTHNIPGTPYDLDHPKLNDFARDAMKGPAVLLTARQAEELLSQFQETAHHRKWGLIAVAILPSHVHIVVGVVGDPDPARVLADFKAYGTRRLNRVFGKPESGKWWTERGSTRKLADEIAVNCGTRYVRDQLRPLVVWISGEVAIDVE